MILRIQAKVFVGVRERQGKGLGTEFIKDIIEYVKKLDVNHIFLQTERELPAPKVKKKK